MDYLSVDSLPCDEFYYLIKWKRLKAHYPTIASYFYDCLTRLRESDKAAIEDLAEHFVIQTKDTSIFNNISFDTDYFVPYYMYSAMINLNMKEDIVCINDLLIDYTICDSITSKRWIGHWLLKLWNHLPEIHMEHTRQKNCTYGGAAFGIPVPKNIYVPRVTNPFTEKEDNRTEEQKEFDQLYT